MNYITLCAGEEINKIAGSTGGMSLEGIIKIDDDKS